MIFVTLLCPGIRAQQRFIVIDMETKVPLRDVKVVCGDTLYTTKWDGSFALDSTLVSSWKGDSTTVVVEMSKPGYMTHRLTAAELTDTLELLPTFNKLSEVVVWGQNRQGVIPFVISPTSADPLEGATPPTCSFTVDIMGGIENLLTHKKRKRQAKVREILKNY